MGIAKSFKSLFKTRKKKELDASSSPKGKPKNPVSRNKSMRMGIYEPYRNHFPLRQNPIPIDKSTLSTTQQNAQNAQNAATAGNYAHLPYGAYNPSRAKLVTANGDFPSNYEYFDPQKRNTNMYASNESIQSNIQSIYQQVPIRNSQLRSSTRSLNDFSQGSIGMIKNCQQRSSMRSTVGSGSLTNVNQTANSGTRPFQYQDWQFNPQMPARPSSVDPYQMMGRGSQQNLAQNNPYMTPQMQRQMVQQPPADLRGLTGLKFDANGIPVTQNPYEIAQAVRKMEQCLQMLNSLQQQQQQQVVVQKPAPQKMVPQQRTNGPTTPQTQQRSFRKTASLQPQPEFQEREARKKRRLRKKSDLSKFDLSDLRKKLETIDRDDSTDSGGDSGYKGDKGYCEGSESSDGHATPEKLPTDHSADDSGESSDSGVQTPPPQITGEPVQAGSKKDFKPILSMTKGILKRSNSQ